MDRIFEIIEYTELDKRRLGTFQFSNTATDWWESEEPTLGNDTIQSMTWQPSKKDFLENIFQ